MTGLYVVAIKGFDPIADLGEIEEIDGNRFRKPAASGRHQAPSVASLNAPRLGERLAECSRNNSWEPRPRHVPGVAEMSRICDNGRGSPAACGAHRYGIT